MFVVLHNYKNYTEPLFCFINFDPKDEHLSFKQINKNKKQPIK